MKTGLCSAATVGVTVVATAVGTRHGFAVGIERVPQGHHGYLRPGLPLRELIVLDLARSRTKGDLTF